MRKVFEAIHSGSGTAGDSSRRRSFAQCRTVLALFAAILAALAAPGARAGATSASATSASPAPDGAQLFGVNCVVCHGEDGRGTETGKALKAADLHSAEVQKETNAMLAQTISEGKNNMPPFMATLSKADIQSLVVYVRSFAKKAK